MEKLKKERTNGNGDMEYKKTANSLDSKIIDSIIKQANEPDLWDLADGNASLLRPTDSSSVLPLKDSNDRLITTPPPSLNHLPMEKAQSNYSKPLGIRQLGDDDDDDNEDKKSLEFDATSEKELELNSCEPNCNIVNESEITDEDDVTMTYMDWEATANCQLKMDNVKPCPCGCIAHALSKCASNNNQQRCFRTREQDSMRLVVFGQDILRYQGCQYTAEEIAPIWKKDCRMWMWKAVMHSKKKKEHIMVLKDATKNTNMQ